MYQYVVCIELLTLQRIGNVVYPMGMLWSVYLPHDVDVQNDAKVNRMGGSIIHAGYTKIAQFLLPGSYDMSNAPRTGYLHEPRLDTTFFSMLHKCHTLNKVYSIGLPKNYLSLHC